ncbi:hypothetical protein D3C81_2152740 [compost metagenome]
MGAVDLRFPGQGGEARQRAVHLLWRAFEQASAAGGEEGVATKQQAGVIIGNVSQGMAGNSDDVEIMA